MKDFSFTGSWWLPERPQRKMAGMLSLSEHALRLVLYDELREVAFPESGVISVSDLQFEQADVVHGIRHEDNALVTLLEMRGYTWGIPRGHVTNHFDVAMALIGQGHADVDAFDRVDAEFDYLKAWIQPPTRVVQNTGASNLAQIRTNIVELGSAELSDGAALRLYSGVAGSWGDDVTSLAEYCALSLTAPDAVPGLSLIARVLRPMQDLLMLSLGRPVRLTEVRLSVGSGLDRLVLAATSQSINPRPLQGRTSLLTAA